MDEWFSCQFWEKSRGSFGGHEEIDSATYAAFKGRFFAMFRKPAKRVASAYLWYSHEFYFFQPQPPNASEYARRARGK